MRAEVLTTSLYPLFMGVLILVLMEYARRDWLQNDFVEDKTIVLILVLMEYARRVQKAGVILIGDRLNPCFNGICAPSDAYDAYNKHTEES